MAIVALDSRGWESFFEANSPHSPALHVRHLFSERGEGLSRTRSPWVGLVYSRSGSENTKRSHLLICKSASREQKPVSLILDPNLATTYLVASSHLVG